MKRILIVLIFGTVFISCRDIINVNPSVPGIRESLLYQNDSITINQTQPGEYLNQEYYENNYNFIDSLRVDFTGETNIDSSNSCSISVELINLNSNTLIKSYTILRVDSINNSYHLGFSVHNIYTYIMYFNIFLLINNGHGGDFYIKMKNVKVYSIY